MKFFPQINGAIVMERKQFSGTPCRLISIESQPKKVVVVVVSIVLVAHKNLTLEFGKNLIDKS